MDRNRIVGDWSIGFREFSIVDKGDALFLECPDGPAGYESRLVEASADRIRIEGGPLHGAELILEDDGPSIGGYRQMTRLERPAHAPPGSGLTVPAVDLGPDEEESFEGLWTWLAHPSRAPEVETGGLDLCRFVQWLSLRRLALFHGANRVDLDRLEPATWPTVTMGAIDETEVVYANGDGLCAMFLALVDEKTAGRGARHRVERFRSPEGAHVDVYHFSLPRPAPTTQPFRAGGLYLLPKERFRPVSLYPGGPQSAEWISPEPVRPLGCLLVTPDDFPLQQAVGFYEEA
jgi:hypothetical protein